METYIVDKWLYTYSNYKSRTFGALHKYTFYLHSDQNIPFQKVYINSMPINLLFTAPLLDYSAFELCVQPKKNTFSLAAT